MTAAWLDDAGVIHYLVAHKPTSTASAGGLTPLAIASQNGRTWLLSR